MTKLLKVRKTNFRGNPNVGMYLYVTDKFCLAGAEVLESEYPALEETLGVPVTRASVAGTGLLGVFLAGTNDVLLVPNIVSDRELAAFKKLPVTVHVIDTTFTALGNNMLVNDNGALVAPDYSAAERKVVEDALGVPVKQFGIEDITVVGSAAVATNTGCLIHRSAQAFEVELAEATLKVPVVRGTVNMGSGFVRGGIAANANGMIIGDTSGGPEIVNAEEALRGANE